MYKTITDIQKENKEFRGVSFRNFWRSVCRLSVLVLILFGLTSCAIPDDIPYPIVKSELLDVEVEGQCDESGLTAGKAIIDADARTVQLYVNDLVDLSDLRITTLEANNDALIIVNDTIRRSSATFGTSGQPVCELKQGLTVDARRPVTVILRTWPGQEFEWTLRIEQVVKREIEVEGQIGDAIIDPITQVAIVYISEQRDLTKLKVNKFSLGGPHGTVSPDPTKETSVDFSLARSYEVTYGWSKQIYEWTVYAYTTAGTVEPSAQFTTTSKGACVVSGNRPNGVLPVIEYRADTESSWTALTEVGLPSATTYEAVLTGLHSDIQYHYRVTIGSTVIEGEPFYFVGEQLENSSFDNWQITGDEKRPLYLPWGEDDEPYWDTGNHGATTVGASNSTFVDEDGRRYANLQSKYIVIKFAAGNIFTGSYLQTDGTNGVLSFGRPFTSRPTQLQFDFQYQTSPITRTGGEWKEAWGQYISRKMYDNIKGQPDSCSVYIALGDWEPTTYKSYQVPYLIRTRPSELHLMDMNSPNLIGYAQMTCGEDVLQWTTKTLDIHYYNDRTPTTIIVVAASSKYGDYFTGGESSLMKIDDIKLKY